MYISLTKVEMSIVQSLYNHHPSSTASANVKILGIAMWVSRTAANC